MINHSHGFILHKRFYRDTSLLLDLFTKEHGRLRAVAKGGRKKALHLFTPYWFEVSIRHELASLFKAETEQAALILNGKASMVGYYLNELLTYLLYSYDPQPKVFEHYQSVLGIAASSDDPNTIQQALRRFERRLLSEIGYEIHLLHEAGTNEPLDASKHYSYLPEQGLVRTVDGFLGVHLIAIANDQLETKEVLAAAKLINRRVINHLLEGRQLKSRELFNANYTRDPS